ncbi:MAG: RICIN domain-containing protein [Bauldia sp.]|nr:RICIN domain-containing protein [Bauldia sp.]
MTTTATRNTSLWLTFRSALVVLIAGAMAMLSGPAVNAQILGNEPSRLVTIQGNGLWFLDATAPDKYNLGLTVVTAPFSGAFSQQWLIASGGNGTYTIQQRSSGLFLDAHEVSAEAFFVVLRPRQTFDSTQLWRIVDYGGGFVTIQQVSSGRFLDATINAAVNYQVVTGLPATQSQEWRLGSP